VRLVKWDEEYSERLEIVSCTKSLKASFLWTKVEVPVWSEEVEYVEVEVIKILEEVMILKSVVIQVDRMLYRILE